LKSGKAAGFNDSICNLIFAVLNLIFPFAAMALTREEVRKVSLLGRLLLSEHDLDKMTSQLGAILDYMELLAEVDTTGVEPMAHALDVANVFREDRAEPSLDRNLALANAPHRDEECYLVPAVLGPGEG
jgi:aspartyl-tRNA(Asn)/glutamyl-tRNA(Gln) amidotransferase subunit C